MESSQVISVSKNKIVDQKIGIDMTLAFGMLEFESWSDKQPKIVENQFK